MDKTKKRRARSKAYPSNSLEECYKAIKQIKSNLGITEGHDRDTIAKAMGSN